MNCHQAQRLWNDWVDGQLEESVAHQLQRHLAECSDCRVARQRANRLQQLLSIKRHETPAAAYFNGFVEEFHRRLEAEEAPAPWTQRVASRLQFDFKSWAYIGGSAVTASLLVGLGWFWFSSQGLNSVPAQDETLADRKPQLATGVTVAALSREPMSVGQTSWPASSVVLTPAAPNATSTPRYVLDRITITPASYEPGSVRF